MAIESTFTNATTRRLVLVDFDWDDADLLPRLLRHPGAAVRLVAGAAADDAGLRMAELCGLPRTVDIADLTREIFDLALVSERSPRRTQIEGLLMALGTPSLAPLAFLEGPSDGSATHPAVEAPMALHAAAFETLLGGGDFERIVEQSLPDVGPGAPTAPTPVEVRSPGRWHLGDLKEFPSSEDRQGLELALGDLMQVTGAGSAELHVSVGPGIERLIQVGTEDLLLKGLVGLALQLGTPQVMSGLAGATEGRTWGAWPFRTTQRRGVLAAAGMPSNSDWGAWERTVEELRQTWEKRDRERAAPAFPLLPETRKDWLTGEDFRRSLELAVERNRRDGLRFSLHRLQFPPAAKAVDHLAERLPPVLRDTDCLTRPAPERILLLTAVPRDQFPHVRRRILAIWQDAWMAVGNERPIPGITEERIEITGPEDGDAFLARAGGWLTGS